MNRIPSFSEFFVSAYVPIAGSEEPPDAGTQTAEPSAEPESTEPATPAPDLSGLEGRMDEMMSTVGELAQRIPETQPGQPAPEDEFAAGGYSGGDPSFGFDPNDPASYDPSQGGIDPNDPDAARQIIQAEAQRAAQAILQPELERQAQDRRVNESEALLEDYPELQEAPAAQALVRDAQEWAGDVTRDIARGNPQLAQALVQEPAFLELVHLAARQADAAENETTSPGSQDAVDIEGASAGNPGGAQPQANLGEQIKGAGQRNQFWTG